MYTIFAMQAPQKNAWFNYFIVGMLFPVENSFTAKSKVFEKSTEKKIICKLYYFYTERKKLVRISDLSSNPESDFKTQFFYWTFGKSAKNFGKIVELWGLIPGYLTDW